MLSPVINLQCVENPKDNRPLCESRERWEDNIKMKTEWDVVDGIHLAHYRVCWRALLR